jgi:outer membrane protein assembly factor BamB
MYQRSLDSQTRMLNLRHFEREAGLLATLNHPAIPKVYDFFEENNRLYLVQELVPGKDLETLLEETGNPFDEKRVATWAIQICDVLHYLHHHQPDPIVFRDMKPSNVLLSTGDRIVLIDFGIARLIDPNERKGTMIGTEGYAPPEQYRGMIDPQGDIYALGASMHHLLTNNDPRMQTPFTFHERPLTKLNPDISPEMESIVSKALAYDAAERWSNAEEFKQALLGFVGVSAGMPASVAGVPSIPTSNTKSTELLWDFTCEDELRSSPVIQDDVLYVGCYDTNLYAIEATTGNFRWKYATEGGISSSPTVWQDLVIVGSEDGAVYGIDTRSGTRRWIFRTDKPVRSSPRVHERITFIGSDDQHFYALDGLRGVLIWKYRAYKPFRSSACIGKGFVSIGCDDSHIYCLEIRSSSLKWKQRTQQPIISTPVLCDNLILVGSMDGTLYALDSESGMIAWKFRTGHGIFSTPLVLGTRIYVGSADGHMYAVEKKNGRLAWKYKTEGQVTSSPNTANGRIYFGSVDHYAYCLDSESGNLIWKFETEEPIVSKPAIKDDIVYVGSMDNRIYALKA